LLLNWGLVLRFGDIVIGCFVCAVGYPLTVIGGILGKNWANCFDAPCRTKNIAREIPSVPWYRSPMAHCIIGGFLPFRFDFNVFLMNLN